MSTMYSHIIPKSSTIKVSFFFFNDTATTEIYTLSLHDALPISCHGNDSQGGLDDGGELPSGGADLHRGAHRADRKSTRLNSSHSQISYAVFCLKKKTTAADGVALLRQLTASASTTRHAHSSRRH